MIPRHFVALFFILVFHELSAQQFSMRMWHEDGLLVTLSRDTLRGNLKYDIPTNSVQITSPRDQKKRVMTFSSKKIMYLEFYDQNLKHFRKFYSIPYQIRNNYKAPILFEILYEAKLSLLSREKIVVEVDSYQSFNYAGSSPGVERLVYSYYFIDETGKIQFYSGKKSELFLFLRKNQDVVRNYVKSNKLKLEEMNDLIRVVAFYNSL